MLSAALVFCQCVNISCLLFCSVCCLLVCSICASVLYLCSGSLILVKAHALPVVLFWSVGASEQFYFVLLGTASSDSSILVKSFWSVDAFVVLLLYSHCCCIVNRPCLLVWSICVIYKQFYFGPACCSVLVCGLVCGCIWSVACSVAALSLEVCNLLLLVCLLPVSLFVWCFHFFFYFLSLLVPHQLALGASSQLQAPLYWCNMSCFVCFINKDLV